MSRSTWVDRGAPAAVILAAIIFGGVVALADLADEPLAPCTPTSTSVCSGPPADHSPNGGEYDSLPPCLTEDSDNCVWDARVDGNGEGRSFVTIDGVTHYLP
ncbi:hypothetical protein SEA_MASHLEY_102 [Microbacterium phage Mashley]|nr:hypothetical protein SEA_MASHLEY_102 [Microbacterium phage Mashley]